MTRLTCLKPRVGAQPKSRLASAGGTNSHERAAVGRTWGVIRRRILSRDCGMCVLCTAAGRFVLAAEVDHKVPVWAGGTDADGNLQSLCRPCHKAKSTREAAERAAGGFNCWTP